MAITVYTIGYTAFSLEGMINEIQRRKITCLIDVRTTPASSYYTDFNKENLMGKLQSEGILYRHYATEFGARQTDKTLYPNGYLDFEKFCKTQAFADGAEKIKKGSELGHSFVLMCAEKDPFNCHRCIMVGKGLKDRGFNVQHITSKNTEISQEDIEKRLLNEYFPNRNQLSLFSSENISDDERLVLAYKKRNAEIGYKVEEE